MIPRRNQEYISVSLSEESFRVAHLKSTGNMPEVLHLGKKNIKGLSGDPLVTTIKDAVQGFRSKGQDVVCVLPPTIATIKNIEIPSLDPAEIRSIIDLQAGRHTPYSRDEILLGYINFGVYQRNYSRILLVVVNRDFVKKQIDTLEAAGLDVIKVLFPPEGIARFYSRALELKSQARPTGIIHIGHKATDFTVGFRGAVIASRCFPVGMVHLLGTDNVQFKKQFFSELGKSIEFYQGEEIDEVPETFLLTADHPKIRDLQPELEQVLKLRVTIVPYWKYIRANTNILKSVAEPNDESFLDIIAAANAANESEIDLIPEASRMKRIIEEKGRQMVRFGVLALLLLILGSALLFVQIYFKNSYLTMLDEQFGAQHHEVTRLEEVATKTRIVKDFLANRFVMLDILMALQSALPNEIYLENLAIDDRGRIEIRGISESMSRVFTLVGVLEDSPLFKSVKTRSTATKRQGNKDVATFEITFQLENAPGESVVAEPEEG